MSGTPTALPQYMRNFLMPQESCSVIGHSSHDHLPLSAVICSNVKGHLMCVLCLDILSRVHFFLGHAWKGRLQLGLGYGFDKIISRIALGCTLFCLLF